MTRRTEAKKTDEPQPDDEVEQEGYDSKETNKEEKQISSTDSQPLTGDSIKVIIVYLICLRCDIFQLL